ncbi:hypothetical protein GCM10007973_03390 [Polymorphobacter multimanifer]|uniref:peptidylprolyl isomerase n=1 Tax=Polymorphobacter multimanifer TaxID=1070431 RepID=UPI00199736BF|nr:peptidylprolyl isomerase [Polymorphobacter multimanifer]GGI69655.1 hypothetical protein GCM10007973_03390 [Polymorphobacter multimanifer]
MTRVALLAAASLLLTAQAPAPTPATTITDPGSVLANAPADDWRPVDIENIVVFETTRGRMVLELAPAFAPMHIKAIRQFVAEGRFDGGAITRVQDNYVVQWAARPRPADAPALPIPLPPLPAEYEMPAQGFVFTRLEFADPYAEAGFIDGWPAGRDPRTKTVWLAHCYGMVGVGREAFFSSAMRRAISIATLPLSAASSRGSMPMPACRAAPPRWGSMQRRPSARRSPAPRSAPTSPIRHASR